MPRPFITHQPRQSQRQRGPSRLERFNAALTRIAKRTSSAAASLFIFAAGTHNQETARLPKAEIRSLRVEGALVVCTTTFICTVFASAMIVTKMPVWAIIPTLALVATFWLLIDRTLLAAFNMADGERLAERFKIPGFYPVKPLRRKLMVAGRILFSVMAMSLVTIMARTVIFGDDIDRYLTIQQRKVNAKVQQKAEALIDRQIGDAQATLSQTVKERNEVRGLISRTDQPADTASIDTAIAAERQSITDFKQRYSALVADYHEAKRAVAAERAGVQAKDGDSGLKGEGARYEYHKAQMDVIRGQVGAARASAQRSAERIKTLESQRTGMKADHSQQSAQGRNVLNPRLADAEAKVALVAKQRVDIVSRRAALVRKMVEADPAFVPKSNGLIARVQALDAVQTGSISAMILSIAMTIMFSLMELAVLLLRVINGTPHIVGAEKVNLNMNALEQIFAARRAKARRSRSPAANDIWVSINDNVVRDKRSDVA